MGSGHWFKKILRLRKSKQSRSKKAKGSLASEKSGSLKTKSYAGKQLSDLAIVNGITSGVSVETIAATRIQTAFRAYKARKSFRRLKGFTKLKILTQGYPAKKQANSAITHLHSWCKIQEEITARRVCMVTEDRIRRKKLASQLKLEAKLHDMEVEWCSGPETMEEIIARLHQREEATVKRERTMAYAFSHQWRANSSQSQVLGSYELGKANWGWSWKERWIAARPWESRVHETTISTKAQNRHPSKVQKEKNQSSTTKGQVSGKAFSANAKGTPVLGSAKGSTKARTLSYPSTEKTVMHER